MRHGFGEDFYQAGAFGFFFVAFDAAGFVESTESLGEVEEVGANQVRGFVVDGVAQNFFVIDE